MRHIHSQHKVLHLGILKDILDRDKRPAGRIARTKGDDALALGAGLQDVANDEQKLIAIYDVG